MVENHDRSRRHFLVSTMVGTCGIANLASFLNVRFIADAIVTAKLPIAPLLTGPLTSSTLTSNDRQSSKLMPPEYYMQQAITQALNVPAFPFGAVIVHQKTGDIVATGFNRSAQSPTFHGEIVAINHCAVAYPSIDWTELDLYTTAEPCPMCQSAIEWAGISTVYYGTSIPYLIRQGWGQIDIRAQEVAHRTPFRQTTVIGGILETECNMLFEAARDRGFRTRSV